MQASTGPSAAATSAIGLGLRAALASTSGLRDSWTHNFRCAGQSRRWQGAEQNGPRRHLLQRSDAFSPQMMHCFVGAGMVACLRCGAASLGCRCLRTGT